MRLEPVLNSFYLLNSLWAGVEPQTCSTIPPARSLIALDAEWTLGRRTADVTAFVDVNVVPMDTERVLPHQTVVVQNGHITALGPASQVTVPPGARRVDGRKKYLMPGIADLHAHFNMFPYDLERRLLRYVANGITTARQTNNTYGLSPFKQRITANEILGPRLYLTASLGEWLRNSAGKVPDHGMAHLTAVYQTGEYQFIDIPSSVFDKHRPVFDSLITLARRLHLPTAAHNHYASVEEFLAFGTAGGSVDHLGATVFKDIRNNWRAQDTTAFFAAVRERVAALKHAGTWVTPTMVCYSGDGAHGLRLILKALQDAGVGLLMAADPVNTGPRSSPSLIHQELAQMVRAGLTPYQAFVTGTRNVAQYFGKLDSSGTVAVGKWADLVLLTGNPLTDVRYIREPAGVMIAGRWLDQTTLDQQLLASPKIWLQEEIALTFYDSPRNQEAGKTFAALIDSLDTPSSTRDKKVYRRILQRVAEEMGALRVSLTPSPALSKQFGATYEQERLDVLARQWMREQARQGYQITVPGVTPGT